MIPGISFWTFSHKQLVLVNGPCFYRGLFVCAHVHINGDTKKAIIPSLTMSIVWPVLIKCIHNSLFKIAGLLYGHLIYILPIRSCPLPKQKTSPRSNGLVCIFWKALRLLDVKETDGFMGYGLLYRVRRSFMVFSLDLEIGFRMDWTGFFRIWILTLSAFSNRRGTGCNHRQKIKNRQFWSAVFQRLNFCLTVGFGSVGFS